MKKATGVRRRKPQQPQKVGKYVLGAKLGVGGFGIVLRATNEETGVEVAVKVLDKSQLQLMQMTSQIKREITLLTTLKHPNIVNGFEILNSTAKLYMVMELVEGGDMHTMVSERRQIPEDDARRYFTGLIKCLAYCHERGVSHRDLKLENLLVTKEGELKVCDFGLASVRALNSNESSLCSTIVGTEDFAAPEILNRQPYEGDKSDMWSAGIILYTMIAGHCPFRGDDTSQLFNAIKRCHFSFPDEFPALPKRVVLSLLVPNPQRRSSAKDILQMAWLQNPIASSESSIDDSPSQLPTGEITELQDQTAYRSGSERASDPDGLSKEPDGLSKEPESNRTQKENAQTSNSQLRRQIQDNPAFALASKAIDGFPELYAALRQDKTLVRDRRWRIRAYPATFLGSEMVSWLAAYCGVSRDEALDIGERMLQAEVFHHVCRDHALKDEYLFYRFAEDSPDSTVLNMRQFWPIAVPPRHPLNVTISLLNSILAVIQLHQVIPQPNKGDDFPEVDVEGLRQDPAFFAFRMAVAELQVVDLALLSNRRQRLAFSINLYHIMSLHIRCISQEGEDGLSQTKVRNIFQYNIAGGRICLSELQELLGYHSVVATRSFHEESTSRFSGLLSLSQQDSGASRRSGFLSRSPRAVLPPSTDGPLRSSTMKSGVPKASSTFFGLLRRTEVVNVVASLRVELQKSEFLFIFLSNGSPSDPALRTFLEEDVTPNALLKELVVFLLKEMSINIKDLSVVLPNMMGIYRRHQGIFGDKDLIAHLAELLSKVYNKSQMKDSNFSMSEDTIAALQQKLSQFRTLQAAKLSAHVAVDAHNDEYFAPSIRSNQ